MPDNPLNTPATKAQADAYANDKADPMGKPYSDKQLASNATAGNKMFLYHKEHGSKMFDLDNLPDEDAGWKEEPFFNHNDGDKPVGEEAEKTEISIEILRAECEKQGLKFDKRWGMEKLMKELEGG